MEETWAQSSRESGQNSSVYPTDIEVSMCDWAWSELSGKRNGVEPGGGVA